MNREIKTIFALDGEQKYQDAIKSINKQQSLLNSEMKKSEAQFEVTGDKQGALKTKIEALNQQIDLQRQKVAESKSAMEQATVKYGQNSDTTQELTKQYYSAEAGLAKLQKQLINTNSDLAKQESKLKAAGEAAEAAGKKMQTIGAGMSKVGTAMTMSVTMPLIAAAGAATKSAMDFESAFAGVRKTVDGTIEQLNELETGIRDLAKETPASAVEISAVAEAAGQLGIKTENILGFSKAMIDMGESTNLTADEAATSLAQFANITQMNQSTFENLGSSIVALGNAGASTEADITTMALRLAGAGKQVGLSEADIVGLAASLADVGIEAEAGGTAFSKVMVQMQLAATTGTTANEVIGKTGKSLRELQMFADSDAKGFKAMANGMGYTSEEFKNFMDASSSLESFSKATGISASEFKKAYEEDAVGAIQLFVKNLATAGDRGEDAITILEDMGITEVRMRDALLRSAGAGDKMAGSIKLSNEAWKENNALTKEASQRYATSESQMKIQKNRITDAAITIGQKLLPVAADLVEKLADAAEAFGNMDPEMQKTALAALGVVAAMGPVLTVASKLTTVIGGATSAWGKYAVKLAEKKAAEAAASAVTGGLGTATTGMAATLGPAAIAIGAVALAAGGLYLAYQESTRSAREAGEAGEDFAAGIASWHDDVDAATSALEGFNMATLVSADTMSEWDAGISDAQGKIVGLAEKAAAESRAYTEKEQEEITNLIGLINDYTDKKIEAYQQQAKVVTAMAEQETAVTHEKANELIKGAEDAKAQTLAIAKAKYNDMIGLAITEYGEEGALNKEAYQNQIDAAKAAYQIELDKANEQHGKTLSAVQQKYADYNKEDMGYIKTMSDTYKQMEDAKTEHDRKLQEAQEAYDKSTEDSRTKSVKLQNDRAAADQEYKKTTDDLYDDLTKVYENASQENLDNWIGMVLNTELYGGKIDDETKEMITNLIASFDYLPDEYKEVAKNALQAMMDGMEEKEPSLFKKADGIGKGLIKSFKNTFQIKSPSKVFRGMGQNNIDAMATGMEDERPNAEKTAADISQGVINAASSSSDIQAYIHAQVTGSGLAAQLQSSGSANYAAVEKAAKSNQRLAVDVSGTVVHKGINDAGQLVGVAESTIDQVEDRLKWEARLAGIY